MALMVCQVPLHPLRYCIELINLDIPAGADSSFDAPSLQLTNMTPQEAR
jgi:hypothetical protein